MILKNAALERHLTSIGYNTPEVWNRILNAQGSVQQLEFLTLKAKLAFRNAFELPQEALVRLAAARQRYICQGQSVNLFFAPPVSRNKCLQAHMLAWQLGLKGLYYLRSRAATSACVDTGACCGT